MADPIIDSLTYTNFKDFFYRDGFVFLPYNEWNNTTTYNVNDYVYYRVTKKIYKSLIVSNINIVPNSDPLSWEEQSIDVFQYVLPEDVERAFQDSKCFGRFLPITDDYCRKEAFLYLTAHFVQKRLNEQNNKTFTPNLGSMSVDSVSESYIVPDWMNTKENIIYTSTQFGIQYRVLIQRWTGFTFTHVLGDVTIL